MSCKKNINIGRGCCFISGDNEEDNIGIAVPGCNKLNEYDWLTDIEPLVKTDDIYEVRFKNTRKGYYRNATELPLKRGDIVAVEASPGHDIGIISLTGDMVAMQMRKSGFRSDGVEFKKIYRIAKPADIIKWQEAIALEHTTMIHARQIAVDLGLAMKIGDVEYQGDKIKAIFYYIADERVDFRELIKIFADKFRIRIEMKQIGARQEAGRIGGIASCGRELCCSTWVSNFVSVTTASARFQEISLNPQKLAGQCGKLKCCLNYEVDSYIDARKDFPRINAPLEALDGNYFLVKTDIFRREMSFTSDPQTNINLTTLSVSRVREIIKLNRRGVKVDQLSLDFDKDSVKEPDFKNVVGEESITRFDSTQGGGNRRRGGRGGRDSNRDRDNRGGGRENREIRDSSDVRDSNSREPREARAPREPREQRAPREPRENRARNSNQDRENRGGGDTNASGTPNEGRGNREPREARDNRDGREPREGQPRRDNNRRRGSRGGKNRGGNSGRGGENGGQNGGSSSGEGSQQ